MIRGLSSALIFILIIFGILLYFRYHTKEPFVNAPSSNMGTVPTPQGTSVVPNTMPGPTVINPDKPTLEDLENTLTRIDFEKRTLENSRSQSDSVKLRIINLDKVKQELSEYIDKINRKKITLNDIPFNKSDLGTFLIKKEDTITTKTLPNTIQESNADDYLRTLGETAKNLKWGIHIEYDPAITVFKSIQDKMDHIQKELSRNKLSPLEIQAKIHELKILEQQVKTANKRAITKVKDEIRPYASDSVETPEPVNNDRPFFIRHQQPHDYTKRVSASSFDNETVAGVDYKKKAAFLCKQIEGADLGDSEDFGCIKNPETDVGPDYSWRGNYKMVCNRLGRIWGGWYPEMFGCPPTVGTEEQAPKIFQSNR